MKYTTIVITILLSGIVQGCYYSKQAAIFLRQQQKAQKITTLLNSPETNADTREFLLLTQHIRNFAISELGLKANKNYTSYLEHEKDYMVDVVQAAGPLSFEPYRWTFLFLGSLPYKGFFSPEDAQKESQRLARKGFDVFVRQVDAFSRLGFFRDPVVSYMKKYSRYHLANLLIHEQVHATVFWKKHAQFNEELAQFIADIAAVKYLQKYADPAELESHQRAQEQHDHFREELFSLQGRLQELYDSALPDSSKLKHKEQMIRIFKDRLRNEYPAIDAVPINNAYISCFQLYGGHDELFQRLFHYAGRSIPRMLEIISGLNPRENPYRQIEELL